MSVSRETAVTREQRLEVLRLLASPDPEKLLAALNANGLAWVDAIARELAERRQRLGRRR